MKKNGFTEVIIVVIVAIIGVAAAYYLGTLNFFKKETPSPTPTQTSTPSPTPTSESTIPDNWLTYESTDYAFEISYPSSYEALDDEENLYGWPNGIVLLYNGGQAYDVAIEVWNSESEYMESYSSRMDDVTVKEYEGKYITLLDNTNEDENSQIIETFTFTQ